MAGALVIGLLDGTGTAVAGTQPAVKALQVTTASLPGGTGGKVYSAKLAATGGIKPYTWSIAVGSLPTGLTLVPATGLINGIPTAGGTSDFTVAVTDSQNPAVTATAAESISVNVPPLVITTTSLPQATAGAAYSAKLAAAGGIKPYTWSLTGGPLPAGLKLAPATGMISGTPTASGDFVLGVAVTDGESPPASTLGSLSLAIGVAPLVVTTGSTLPTATSGAPYSVRLAAAGGIKPYSWSVAGGSLPAGLKLSAGGLISGTPTTDGPASFTVQVADAENPAATATATESITVADQLAVTTTSLPGGVADQPYSATLAAAGGVGPYTWSVSSGSLPAGLSLDPATGAISGAPAGTGTAAITATVTDAGNPPVTASASLTIAVTALPLAVTTTGLPTGTMGQPYAATLAASGGVTPYTWSLSPGQGSLPAGLTLDPSTGSIGGAPDGPGTSTFTVQVTDSDNPAVTATAQLEIIVGAPLAVSTTSLPTALQGQSYSQTLTAVGGIAPYTWSVSSGSLPPGLSLDPSTGIISGSPSTLGKSLFVVTVTDSGNPATTAQAQLTIGVVTPLEMTTSSLPNVVQGTFYQQSLSGSGGSTPYSWSLSPGSGPLPPGLSLSPLSGQIAGDPNTPGIYSFNVQLTDSSSPQMHVSTALTITVIAQLKVTSPGTLPKTEVGQPYSAQLSATGGVPPYTWSIASGNIPGLMLNPSTGQITGTPTALGGPLLVQVSDVGNPGQTVQANENIDVAPQLTIDEVFYPNGTVGQNYQGQVAVTGGYSPYSFSVTDTGGVPPGLQLDPDTGGLIGVPSAPGAYPFTLVVTDSNNPAATTTVNEVVAIAPQLQVVTTNPPPGVQFTSYSFLMQAVGGYQPYTWSAPDMPPGLFMLPNGAVGGVAAAPGVFPVPVTVTDSATPQPNSVTTIVTFTVIPAPPPGPSQRPGQAAMHSGWGRLRG
jgi:hypothetical protein